MWVQNALIILKSIINASVSEILMHFSMNLQGEKNMAFFLCTISWKVIIVIKHLNKDHLQACRNAKAAYSPLGRLAKSLTSISLVLLARSSFSTENGSFWKLWGAGKSPSDIIAWLSCGKEVCLWADSVGKCTERSELAAHKSGKNKEHLCVVLNPGTLNVY